MEIERKIQYLKAQISLWQHVETLDAKSKLLYYEYQLEIAQQELVAQKEKIKDMVEDGYYL